ncbi:MAG: hypothetical protein GY722_13700 [bacterium]|nr:hypothetical protein [bacterium]
MSWKGLFCGASLHGAIVTAVLIGGVVYVLVLLFALALCRVASPTDEHETEADTRMQAPSQDTGEGDQSTHPVWDNDASVA